MGTARSSKLGRQKDSPSHKSYNSQNRRKDNKIRRITKNNSDEFLAWWLKTYG